MSENQSWGRRFDVCLAGYRVPGQRQHFEGAAPLATLYSGLPRRRTCPRLFGGLALDPQESEFHWNWSGGGSFFIYSDLAGAQAFILNSSAFSSGKFYPTVFLLPDIFFPLGTPVTCY